MKRFIVYILICSVLILGGCAYQMVLTAPVEEYSDTRLLMDTVCTIRAGGKNPKAAVDAAFARIEEIANKVDYYSDSSEVAAINKAKANRAVSVSEDVFFIIEEAQKISEKTEGAFDITIAPLKDLWNIQQGGPNPPAEEDIKEAQKKVNYKNIILGRENKTVTLSEDDVKIDLGGAAKGYAADCAIDTLKEIDIAYALVDLGGNIYATGKNPSRPDGRWLVGIQKPFAEGSECAETVLIDEGAVVTAGTYQRYFVKEDKVYHHIIDSKTGYPSNSGVESATIVGETALVADCLSTACVVLGEEKGKELADAFGVELIIAEE